MMMRSYPGIDPEISTWKGQNITDFQEDLRIKVNGQLSEKWFYTHMKGENKSLPRIDVLNILSKYAGYLNWQDFINSKTGKVLLKEKPGKPAMFPVRTPLIFISVMVLILIIVKMINTQNYRFTFIDSDTGEPIDDNNLRIELLDGDDSPAFFFQDDSGGITIRTDKSQLRMVIKSANYLPDTIVKSLRKFKRSEQISLNVDYYALMISYFSRSDVSSWEKRREQLAGVLSENAIIYQFPEDSPGNAMAIYNKWEFIDKMTMPTTGLRQIEILDTRYRDGKIVILRFRIKRETE